MTIDKLHENHVQIFDTREEAKRLADKLADSDMDFGYKVIADQSSGGFLIAMYDDIGEFVGYL